MRRARDGALHGDLKAWRHFFDKRSGNVTIVAPSSLERSGGSAPAVSAAAAKHGEDPTWLLPWSFDAGP